MASTFVAHSYSQYDPIAGIAYNLILIRVAQNRAEPMPNLEIAVFKSIVVKNDKNDGSGVEQGVHRENVRELLALSDHRV